MPGLFNLLIKFIIPLGVLYLLFYYFGTLGGVAGGVLYFVFTAFLNRSVILQNRASKKYRSGDLDGALKDMEAAVRITPAAYKTRGAYAYLLLKLGHTEKAAEEIDKALSQCNLESDKNSMKVTKAMVLWRQKKLDEAIELLEELLKDYQNSNVYGALGFMYIEKGDYKKALSFNLEAHDFNNTNTIILDNLGLSYYLNGEYDKSLELYKEILKLKPSFPEAFYNYGRVLEHFGEIEEALYMCRTAQTLKFWNTSTITREEVDEAVVRLEEKEQSMEKTRRTVEPSFEEQDGEIQGEAEKNTSYETSEDANA